MLYYKLVRDKIPEIIEKSGKRPLIEILSDDDYKIYLERKLDEEVKEYQESKELEELADILEVIVHLVKIKGYDFQDLLDLQARKATEKGGFSKKILLKAVCEEC